MEARSTVSLGLSEEQLAIRASGIGASEVAALAGEDPRRGPMDIWLVKKGLAEDAPDHVPAGVVSRRLSPLERGNRYEDTAAKLYQDNHPELVVKQPEPPGTFRHPQHVFALASPDRIAWLNGEIDRLLECKTADFRMAHLWGEPGTDEVPAYYLVQAQWQCFVMGIARVDFPVLLGWEEYREFRVDSHVEIQAGLLEIVSRFVRDHLETDTPPPVDASDASKRFLQSTYPRAVRPLMPAPPNSELWAKRYRDAADVIKAAELEKDQAANHLRELIGDAEGIEGSGWRAKWTNTKETEVHFTRKASRTLRVTFNREE